jgi:hypothetical protein
VRNKAELSGAKQSRDILCSLSLLLACVLFGSPRLEAQTPGESAPPAAESVNQLEYNVKAAFLYSFGRYVEWPESLFSDKESPFVIGVYGKNPFGEVLERIAKTRTIQGRRIEVKIIDSIDGLADCQLIFIPQNVSVEQQRKIVDKVKGTPLLLVGETAKFAEIGGDVNFFMEGDHVRFEINVDTLRNKKLLIDAKLLSLAKKISTVALDNRDRTR